MSETTNTTPLAPGARSQVSDAGLWELDHLEDESPFAVITFLLRRGGHDIIDQRVDFVETANTLYLAVPGDDYDAKRMMNKIALAADINKNFIVYAPNDVYIPLPKSLGEHKWPIPLALARTVTQLAGLIAQCETPQARSSPAPARPRTRMAMILWVGNLCCLLCIAWALIFDPQRYIVFVAAILIAMQAVQAFVTSLRRTPTS